MNENVENITVEETEVTETETALTAPEMDEVPEYLVPDDESDDESDEPSEGMSTKTKAMLAAGAALLAGAGIGGILLKKRHDKKLDEADPGAETRGPKPISDKKGKVKAIRSRKLTLREKLTGRLYLDPAEVELFEKLRQMQNEEETTEETETK